MFAIWVVFHVIVCAGLVIVVLMQSSKGEGLAGSAFGGGGGGGLSGALFGGRGAASFLSKATTVLAVVFMLNCGALAYMSAGTRTVTSGPGDTGNVESAVTRRAQQERDLQMQRQQQMMADSTVSIEDLTGQPAPADTSGN